METWSMEWVRRTGGRGILFWWIREYRGANIGVRYKPWRNGMDRKWERSEVRKGGMGEEGIHAYGERSW